MMDGLAGPVGKVGLPLGFRLQRNEMTGFWDWGLDNLMLCIDFWVWSERLG